MKEMSSCAGQQRKQPHNESPNEDKSNKLYNSSTVCDKSTAKVIAVANTLSQVKRKQQEHVF